MKRAGPLTLLLCIAACSAGAAQLNYTLYVVGLPVADASLNVDMSGAVYRGILGFHTIGLTNLVDSGRLEETTTGHFEGDRPVPQVYTSSGYLHGQTRMVDMTWRDGTPVVTAITPPNATEREDVPEALRAGTVDPISLIVLLIHLADQTGRCDGTARGYDGRDLQVFNVRTMGQENLPSSIRSSFSGHAERCDFVSQTVAGFRLNSGDQDRRPHRGTIWLAHVLPGNPPLPVRASVETRWFGSAMIYLTSVSP
jgi:hypothetical protein